MTPPEKMCRIEITPDGPRGRWVLEGFVDIEGAGELCCLRAILDKEAVAALLRPIDAMFAALTPVSVELCRQRTLRSSGELTEPE